MAIADVPSSIADLPAEGRTLGELIELLISPEAWILLTTRTGDRPPPPAAGRGERQLLPVYLSRERLDRFADKNDEYAVAVRACLPLLDAWNADRLIAKGRRGSPIAPSEEIPPPRIRWTMVIESLTRSTLRDPGNRLGKIYDLHFYPKQDVTSQRLHAEPPEYANLRHAASEAFPSGWQGLRPGIVIDAAGKKLPQGYPVPKRDVWLRALGFRKD
jgi:hypothetical protein